VRENALRQEKEKKENPHTQKKEDASPSSSFKEESLGLTQHASCQFYQNHDFPVS
jgi:hypothetical protein